MLGTGRIYTPFPTLHQCVDKAEKAKRAIRPAKIGDKSKSQGGYGEEGIAQGQNPFLPTRSDQMPMGRARMA